jgi:hypothetical protein
MKIKRQGVSRLPENRGTLDLHARPAREFGRQAGLRCGLPVAACFRRVICRQLVWKSAVSQAIGVQFELVAPAQHVSAFNDLQFADKSLRVAEGFGNRRGLDQLRQVHSGLPPVSKLEVDSKIRICLGLGDAVHDLFLDSADRIAFRSLCPELAKLTAIF